jgi:hypothetical protein
MNASERKAKEDRYRFCGVYSHDKAKYQESCSKYLEKKPNVKHRTVSSSGGGYALYIKYKPLKGVELEKAVTAFEAKLIERSTKQKESAKAYTELKILQEKIHELNRSVDKINDELTDMQNLLLDSKYDLTSLSEIIKKLY